MTLLEVLGQPVAVTILENSRAQGRLAHAYLFYGDEGVVKRQLWDFSGRVASARD